MPTGDDGPPPLYSQYGDDDQLVRIEEEANQKLQALKAILSKEVLLQRKRNVQAGVDGISLLNTLKLWSLTSTAATQALDKEKEQDIAAFSRDRGALSSQHLSSLNLLDTGASLSKNEPSTPKLLPSPVSISTPRKPTSLQDCL
jgi:hypothetical protein